MSNLRPLSRVRELVVIGGGIAGCTIAYELARRGQRVTLLEQRSLAWAASGRNLGLLLNHVEREAVEQMHAALAIYREVEALVDFELRALPQLLLAREPSQLDAMAKRAAAMRELGLTVRDLDAGQLAAEVPALGGAAGAAVIEQAWSLRPELATLAFAEAARSAGAEIRSGVRAHLVQEGGVLTDAGRLAADGVVLAAGPWVAQLAAAVPVSVGRGWAMRVASLPQPVPFCLEEMSWPDQDEVGRVSRWPALREVAGGEVDEPAATAFALAPQRDGSALLGTSLSPSLGGGAVEGEDMPARLAERAIAAMPSLAGVPVMGAWSGMRPLTPDGRPLAGALGPGLWVHGGHGSVGMQVAPATARWLASAMLDGGEEARLAGLDPLRFTGRLR